MRVSIDQDAPITWDQFVAANPDLSAESLATIQAELERSGRYEGGGGAAGQFVIQRVGLTTKDHTPGPWKAVGTTIEARVNGQFVRVATVPVLRNAIEGTANAYLLAAAPELLDALNGFLLGAPSEKALAALVGEDVVRDARAAIAVVTGTKQ